jgi:hypothetical protein
MRPILLAGGLLLFAAPAAAQSLAARITGAPDGEVRLAFGARPGVCGDGVRTIRNGERHRSVTVSDEDDEWQDGDCPCEPGPVRVSLTVRDHRVTRVRTAVGGGWRTPAKSPLDLGVVPVRQAVTALLGIAADPDQPAGDRAIFPATLADSVEVWRDLLRLARNDRLPRDVRRQAVFWLSQAAGDSATAGLADLAAKDSDDREVRRQAVFALSQRPRDEGVPALIRVARTNRDPEIRRTALFWLGQSDDPRALNLFEELLVKR